MEPVYIPVSQKQLIPANMASRIQKRVLYARKDVYEPSWLCSI